MSNEPSERMRGKDIISEPGAHELASSADMKTFIIPPDAVPYVFEGTGWRSGNAAVDGGRDWCCQTDLGSRRADRKLAL
jgi:hypothetical protein